MPDSLALVDALRADGVPAVVSGAGPTVLAFVHGDGPRPRRERCPEGWTARIWAIDRVGVRVVGVGARVGARPATGHSLTRTVAHLISFAPDPRRSRRRLPDG